MKDFVGLGRVLNDNQIPATHRQIEALRSEVALVYWVLIINLGATLTIVLSLFK